MARTAFRLAPLSTEFLFSDAAGEDHTSVDAAQSSSGSIINSRVCQRNWATSLASIG